MTDPESVASALLQPVADGYKMRPSGAWAKDKLDILARYIETSTLAMKDVQRNPWRRRIFIDVEAGPGKNCVQLKGTKPARCPPESSDVFLGSPLLALSQGIGYTDYYFIEMKKAIFTALSARCQPAIESGQRINLLAGDCNRHVEHVVGEIQRIDAEVVRGQWSCLCLVFVDPTGLEVKWSTIEKVSSLRAADLLINFPTGTIRRNCRQQEGLPVGTTKMDDFFGTADWRKFLRTPRPRLPVNEWADLYRDRIAGLGYQWGTDISFKNRNDVELYWLMFASKSALGIKLWEDARTKGPSQLALNL